MLDSLYLGGLSQLFIAICLVAVQKFGVERKSVHLDSTSFAVEGDYLHSQVTGSAVPVPMNITYLLVYHLGQQQLRLALQQTNQTLPNQLGKGTQRPTLRWGFQCFMAVHYVVLNGVKSVVNLTDARCRILQFLGSMALRKYVRTIFESSIYTISYTLKFLKPLFHPCF